MRQLRNLLVLSLPCGLWTGLAAAIGVPVSITNNTGVPQTINTTRLIYYTGTNQFDFQHCDTVEGLSGTWSTGSGFQVPAGASTKYLSATSGVGNNLNALLCAGYDVAIYNISVVSGAGVSTGGCVYAAQCISGSLVDFQSDLTFQIGNP